MIYDRLIEIDLSTIRPMIAMPVHPSSTYTIEEFQANMADILHETEERAKVSLSAPDFTLQDKVRNGRFYVEQGIIAKEPLAKKAIPNCNITCITGKEMKEALEGYLKVLFEQDPKSVGGSLPGDEFYYGV